MVDRVIGVRIDAEGARRGARQVRSALQDIQRTGQATTRRLRGLKDAIFSIKGAFAGLGVALAGRELIQTATNLERVERGLKQATGSVEGAADAMTFLAEETDRLGINLEAAEDSFVSIGAAARGTKLEGEETKQVFLGVASASAALGLSAEQTGGALTAIEQIISKGKVSAEELRGQLGERLPGAFQIAARALGTTTAQLDEWLAQGKLAAEDFIPLFSRQLRLEFGGAAEEAADSLQGSINRMSNAWLQFKRALATSGALEPIQEAIDAITQALSSEAVLEGAAAAARALGNAMKFVAENIDLVVVALKALLAAKIAGTFANLGVGAFRFAAGLSAANKAALAAAAGAQGLARASAAATAGMTALRGVGLALGGPVGILVGVATAAIIMGQKFFDARKETEDLKEELQDLGKTRLELEGERITDQIAKVEKALEDARARQAKAQATLDRGRPEPSTGGFLGVSASELNFDSAQNAARTAAADVAFFEEKLQILKDALENLGEPTEDIAAQLAELQAGFQLTGEGTDAAGEKIEDAREALQGMAGDLEESVATFEKSEAAVLKYRLTQGDLADEVAALGEEGIALRDKLIRLAEAYEKLETDAEAAEFAQSTFEDLYEGTRTKAEAYADELARLDELYILLASSSDLTAEQLAQLPEIFERLREEAKETAEGTKEPFDAMTEFATAAARSMQGAMSDLFFSVMQGEFDDLADNFKSTIDRMVADFLASQLLNFIGNLGASSGNPFLQAFGAVVNQGRQQGGSARAGEAILVGEAGPEIFTPQQNGRIIPNRTVARMDVMDASETIQRGGFDRQATQPMKSNISRGLGGVDGKILERPGAGATGFNRYAGRHQGGPVFRGQPVVAGEAGPELFVNGGGGGGGGGGGPVTVNMNITAQDADSFRQSQGQILAEFSRLLQGARIRNG